MMMFSIITRGKAKKYMQMLTQSGMGFHLQAHGVGTAPSEMMDIFGLGTNDKDIVITLAPESAINSYAFELSKGIDGSFEYGGLMICVRLSAINRLTSELVTRATRIDESMGGKRKVKNAQKNQLILVTVNDGYTDAVMETAKKAGAMGGTVMRARLADSGIMEQLGEKAVHQEREIIMIFAPSATAPAIMESVNREHGIMTDANGMVLSLPVEKAFKI
jgi:hypothetical protein